MPPVQKVSLEYDGRVHWFEVHRYQTMPELHAALYSNNIREFEKDTIAYTDCFMPELLPNGKWKPEDPNECGRMYLLDSSVDTMAHEATHMALGIIARHGHSSIVATTDIEPELSHDLCKLVGFITSELYGHNKYF